MRKRQARRREMSPITVSAGAEGNASGTLVGPYELMDVMGAGGGGIVYRARDSRNGRLLALKTARRQRDLHLSSLRREIQTLTRIRHRGIVQILDGGVQAGFPWYAMELVEGPALRSTFTPTSSGDGALASEQQTQTAIDRS